MSNPMPPVPPPPSPKVPGAAVDPPKASPPAEASKAAASPVGVKPPPTPQPKGKNVLPEPEEKAEDLPEIVKPQLWENPRTAAVAGLATSLLIHASVIILAAVLFYNVKDQLQEMVADEQVIIPTSELATDTPGGIPNPGMNDDPTRAAAQSADASVTQSDSWAETKSDNLQQTLSSGATGESTPTVIGMGGVSAGAGDAGLSSGAAGGGKLAKFGAPGGGQGMGPQSNFIGTGGNAHRIVFIVDATGSMSDRWNVLVRELQTTVTKLKPSQSFNIVLFRDGGYVALDKGGLIPALPPNKKRADDFLKQNGPVGKTIPFEAIETALRMKPELAYVLVDPFIFDTMTSTDPVKDFTEALRKGKGNSNMKMNFIMFHTRSASKSSKEVQPVKTTLEGLAKEFGGKLANVSMEDLFAGR